MDFGKDECFFCGGNIIKNQHDPACPCNQDVQEEAEKIWEIGYQEAKKGKIEPSSDDSIYGLGFKRGQIFLSSIE